MFTPIIPVVLACFPAAYELDFGALPPAKTGKFRDFVIILCFKGEPGVKMPFGFASEYGPNDIADGFVETLKDPRWKLQQNARKVLIYGYDDVLIERVVVEGVGPKDR